MANTTTIQIVALRGFSYMCVNLFITFRIKTTFNVRKYKVKFVRLENIESGSKKCEKMQCESTSINVTRKIIRTANNRENYVEILMSHEISRSENENILNQKQYIINEN